MSDQVSDRPSATTPQAVAGHDLYSAEATALANNVLAFEKSGSSGDYNGLMKQWQNISDKGDTTPGYTHGVEKEAAKIINQSDDPLMPQATVNADGSMSFEPSILNSLGSHLSGSMEGDLGVKGNLSNLWPGGEGYGFDQANNISYGVRIGGGGGDGGLDVTEVPDASAGGGGGDMG